MNNLEHIKDFLKFQEECPETLGLNKEVSIPTKKGSMKFKYADLPSIMKVIKPLANKHNFVLYHEIDGDYVRAILVHLTGEKFTSSVKYDSGLKAKDKGAEITYCKRYALSALCGIVTDEDNDAPQEKMNSKSPLNEKGFDAAILKIKNGEKNVLKNCMAFFELTQKQQDTLLNLDLEYNG